LYLAPDSVLQRGGHIAPANRSPRSNSDSAPAHIARYVSASMAVSMFGHAPPLFPLAEALTVQGAMVAPAPASASASPSTSATSRQQLPQGSRAGGAAASSGGIGKRSVSRRGLSKFYHKARSFASFDEATLCAMCDDKSVAVLAKHQPPPPQHRADRDCTGPRYCTNTLIGNASAPTSPHRPQAAHLLPSSHRLRRLGARRTLVVASPARSLSDPVAAVAEQPCPCPAEGDADVGLTAVCRALEAACMSDHPAPTGTTTPSTGAEPQQPSASVEGWVPPVGAWAFFRPSYIRTPASLADNPASVEVMQCT